MRYSCHYCGNPELRANDRFCARCGAPQPARKPAAAFFLSILYAFFIWGIMFVVREGITLVYSFIVQDALPYTAYMDETAYYNAYWSVFSKYFAIISMGAAFLTVLIYTLFYTLRGKRFEREISLSKMSLPPAAAIFIWGAAAQIVVTVSISLLSLLFPSLVDAGAQNSEYYEMTFGGGSFALEVLYISVIAPVLEEVVFRGLIYTRLRRAMPILAAQILSALIFGAAHMNMMQFVYASLIGFIMAAVFEKFQSIWASILFHVAFNACSYLTVFIESDTLAFSLYFICIAIFLFAFYYIFTHRASNAETIPQSERNLL